MLIGKNKITLIVSFNFYNFKTEIITKVKEFNNKRKELKHYLDNKKS